MLGILAVIAIISHQCHFVEGKKGFRDFQDFQEESENYKKVCYVTNWSLTRPEARFSLDTIPLSLCTHLIYAFANIDVESLSIVHSLPEDISKDETTGNFEKLNNLKSERPELRTLLSVGGALAGTDGFEAVSKTLFSRKKFSVNVAKYLRRWNFDGLDIDWEFPDIKTKNQFTLLIQELRTSFDRRHFKDEPPLLLSAAVGVSEEQITQSYEVRLISDLLDFINVMSYDFHGSWDTPKVTGLSSPLFSRSSRDIYSVDWALNAWVAAGASPEKLLLGIAAEGRTFTLADATRANIGSPFLSAGERGAYTNTSGALAYFEICELVYRGVTRRWDAVQQGPFLSRDTLWVAYDSPRSVGIKSSYIMRKGLGGAMVWALDLDDFSGTFCKKGNYPLLTTINKVLDGTTIVKIDWPSSAHRLSSFRKCILLWVVIFILSVAW